ncbi:MAG: hypothetical protein ACRC6K_01320 [Fusobacteriaceae bacterium]
MSFKDLLEKDLKNVFYNTNEFADKIILDGEEYIGIISEIDFNDKYLYKEATTGLITQGLILSIQKSEFFKDEEIIPVDFEISAGTTLKLNNKKYTVIKFIDKDVDYDIHLERISEN